MIFVPLEAMSGETSTNSAPGQAVTPQVSVPQTTAPTAPVQQQGSIMPPGSGNRESEDLVKQLDLVKQQANEKDAENKAMQEELLQYRKEKAAQAEQYKTAQLPKYNDYINGKDLSEAKKAAYLRAMTDIRHKEDADQLWKEHTQLVSLQASKKAADEELAKERAEKAKLADTLAKVGQQVGGMRRGFVEEQPIETTASIIPVGASKLGPGEVFNPMPGAEELSFMQNYNYGSGGGGVQASANGQEQKVFRTSIKAARTHPLLTNEQGEEQFEYSARKQFPQVFAWMVNEAGMEHRDHSNMVMLTEESLVHRADKL